MQIDEVYPNVDMYNGHPGSPTISEIKVISKTEQKKTPKSKHGSSVLDSGGVSTDSRQSDNSYGPSDSNVSGLRMSENKQPTIRKNGLCQKREKCSRGMLVAGGSSVTGVSVLSLTFFAFHLLVRHSRKVRQK